jgi:hypothetical protein
VLEQVGDEVWRVDPDHHGFCEEARARFLGVWLARIRTIVLEGRLPMTVHGCGSQDSRRILALLAAAV